MEDCPSPPVVEMEILNDVASSSASGSPPPNLPPSNFGVVVADEVYRSACPVPENFGFLKTLKLKSIM